MTVPVPLQRLASTLLGVLASLVLLVNGVQHGWGLAWLGYGLVGSVILWHRPSNTIGWLCLAIASGMAAASAPPTAYAEGLLTSGILVAQVAGPLAFLALIALVALFPSGHAEGRIPRIVAWCTAALSVIITATVLVDPTPVEGTGGWVSPLAVQEAGGFAQGMRNQGFALVPLLLALSVTSLVRRWRRSEGAERLRYRWFGAAAAVSVVNLIVVNLLPEGSLLAPVLYLANNALPISLAVAVTRYGLYEFDRVISRTASYAIVTGVLVATYALVVTSVSRLLGESSTLAVAAATLAAAALVRPLLARVQRVVDRRFNRGRVDHERAADDFAAGLRHQVDEAHVRADLVRVVTRTLQPAGTSLWLRERTR
jgi:hypothetical protein